MESLDGVEVFVRSLVDDPNYDKCLRCWKYTPKEFFDKDNMFPCVCNRCASALHELRGHVEEGEWCNVPHAIRGISLTEFDSRFVRRR